MQTSVTGPGALTFRWRIDRPSPSLSGGTSADGTLKFDIRGETVGELRSLCDWQEAHWDLPPGPHTLRWRFVGGGAAAGAGTDTAFVDAVSFQPGSDFALAAAALGQPGLALIVGGGGGGSAAWSLGNLSPGPAGVTFPLSPNLGYGAISFEATGPAKVSLRPLGSVTPLWFIDGQARASQRSSEFPDQWLLVPEGLHRISCRIFAHSRSETVALLVVSPLAAVSLADAVEADRSPGLTVTAASGDGWQAIDDPSVPDSDTDYAWA